MHSQGTAEAVLNIHSSNANGAPPICHLLSNRHGDVRARSPRTGTRTLREPAILYMPCWTNHDDLETSKAFIGGPDAVR